MWSNKSSIKYIRTYIKISYKPAPTDRDWETNELDRILKSLNIKVDLPTVGKVGATGADVAFDSKTGSFPRILKTLENLDAPDEIKNLFKSTKLTSLKNLSPDLKFASEIDRPEKALTKELFDNAFKENDIVKPFKHHDRDSFLSTKRQHNALVKAEAVSTKTFGKAAEQIKDLDIPKGTLLKASAKGILRAISPFIPFVGAVGVGLGELM